MKISNNGVMVSGVRVAQQKNKKNLIPIYCFETVTPSPPINHNCQSFKIVASIQATFL
jgi:hypothetical protein